MADKSQDIISLINQYTSELEALDQLNITYIMTCLGIIGVILGIIATIISLNQKVWKSPPYRLVAPLFLSIPVIISTFLGVVTMNCRKVAMYRSYLIYLEQSYNEIDGVIPQHYNSRVLQFLSKWGVTNQNGSFTNLIVDIVYIIIIGLCFAVCFYFARVAYKKASAAKSYNKRRKVVFYIAYILVFLTCVIICIACFIDLIINSVTIEKVLSEIRV